MGMQDDYVLVNNVYYSKNAPQELINVLENCRQNKTRIVIDFGDTKTGVSWEETYGVAGRISSTTGPLKRPILVHNKRSLGGLVLADDCILSVKTSLGKKVLYEHPLLVE